MADTNLTKTCKVCGLQKPLNAFVQISGEISTLYGNICADCRKLQGAEKTSKDHEEGTSSRTGQEHGIDSKTKAKEDIDKINLQHNIEERYHEERGEKEAEETVKKEKTEQIKQAQIKHQQEIREKRRTFLDEPRTQRTPTDNSVMSPEDLAEQEQRTDFQGTFYDTQIGKIKYQYLFKNFEALLGKKIVGGAGSPPPSSVNQAIEEAKKEHDKNKKQTETPEKEKDELLDYAQRKMRGR